MREMAEVCGTSVETIRKGHEAIAEMSGMLDEKE
jgi:hypothetical protein